MKFKCEVLVLLCVMAMNAIQLEASPPFGDLLNNPKFNPILSITFTMKESHAICEANGLLPITYTIKVLNRNEQYFINNNIVSMTSGYNNKSFLVCEGKSVFKNVTWTKTILLYTGIRNFPVRLINGNSSNKGLIQFYYSGKWRFPCDESFSNNVQGRKNGDVVCRELGFSGVDVMKRGSTFGGRRPFYMEAVYCDGTETSLAECRSSIGPNPNSRICGGPENNAAVICFPKFIRLINGTKPNEGLIQFYHSGNWRFACDDDFLNDEQGKINGDVICRELGFPGVDVMKSDGTFGRNKTFYMDNVKCMGNETSLSKCSSSIGSNAHDCRPDENPAGIICRNATKEEMKIINRNNSVIEFNSSVTTDFNGYETVELKCIFEINSTTFLTFEIWRKQGSNNRMIQMYDINSTLKVIKATNESIIISYTHTYVPSEPNTNDSFVCLVKDVTSVFSGRKELFIEYSYVLKQITLDLIYPRGNISIFNTSTNATESESRIASHVLCSVNFDSSNASFTWSYTATNGTNSFEGQILDLNGIEQRLPICCQVTLGPNNISKCITPKEQPETPILRTSTFCRRRSFGVDCPRSTDVVFSSIYVGYFQTCSPRNYESCQIPMFTKFIKEERCTENRCRIYDRLFKKSYINHFLQHLGNDCLNGTIPFMKLDYYCLQTIPTSV